MTRVPVASERSGSRPATASSLWPAYANRLPPTISWISKNGGLTPRRSPKINLLRARRRANEFPLGDLTRDQDADALFPRDAFCFDVQHQALADDRFLARHQEARLDHVHF